jgi:chaperone modulatory protein CbpM
MGAKMNATYSQAQVLLQVTQLTQSRLAALVETEAVIPTQTEVGPMFDAADLARMTLLCEFEEIYDMTPEALAVMIAVIDQLHAARQDRRSLLTAIGCDTVGVQMRVAASLAEIYPRPD